MGRGPVKVCWGHAQNPQHPNTLSQGPFNPFPSLGVPAIPLPPLCSSNGLTCPIRCRLFDLPRMFLSSSANSVNGANDYNRSAAQITVFCLFVPAPPSLSYHTPAFLSRLTPYAVPIAIRRNPVLSLRSKRPSPKTSSTKPLQPSAPPQTSNPEAKSPTPS